MRSFHHGRRWLPSLQVLDRRADRLDHAAAAAASAANSSESASGTPCSTSVASTSPKAAARRLLSTSPSTAIAQQRLGHAALQQRCAANRQRPNDPHCQDKSDDRRRRDEHRGPIGLSSEAPPPVPRGPIEKAEHRRSKSPKEIGEKTHRRHQHSIGYARLAEAVRRDSTRRRDARRSTPAPTPAVRCESPPRPPPVDRRKLCGLEAISVTSGSPFCNWLANDIAR